MADDTDCVLRIDSNLCRDDHRRLEDVRKSRVRRLEEHHSVLQHVLSGLDVNGQRMAVPAGIGAVRERRLGDHTAIQYVAKAFGKGTVFAILTVLFAPIPYAIIEFSDAQYVGSKEPAQF